ncbi:MAG TPA: [protein-PII] uridylyltransferase [Polyangiaceae bacterium LLY-WYZ-14_1]|nr:[protein-PII] uridylyltransferase [Polyangiaceae bacterium LLY-WYZ-14_1]
MAQTESQPAIDLGRYAPDLGVTCDDYLVSHRAALAAAVRRGEGGLAVARLHARALDGLLGALHCASDAAARRFAHPPAGRVALVAVGGYGRGELGFHSDVDVLFLCDDPADAHAQGLAEGVLYPVWDLGQRVGHAVRGVSETLALAREDLRTATTLLDLRPIAGDRSLVDELLRRARREVFGPGLGRFLDALGADSERRHERFGSSIYLLEPEVKLGRGGLRDVDVAFWAAKARWPARRWDDLVRLGVLLPRELAELADARELLWRTRNLLHLRAGRLQDRLTFADQEETAAAFGLEDSLRQGLAVERFMQTYYRHARLVAQTSERMLDRARPRVPKRVRQKVRPLGDGTAVFDGRATLVDANALDADPALALRLYRTVQREGLPPESFARDCIARAAAQPGWRARFREDPAVPELFLALLNQVGEVPVRRGSLIGELHELGLVGALIPEVEQVTGRVQHDLYHVYTVDVHSVRTVDCLVRLARGEGRDEHPVAVRLASEVPRRLPLLLAALLHDVGKTGGRGHAERGAPMAEAAARRLGVSPVDAGHVGWLVREHLRLYHWATRRDLADPEVVAEIARTVGTVERLRDLYLLTIADVGTTHPGALTGWKTRMLDQALTAVTHALEAETVPDAGRRAAELRLELLEGARRDADADAQGELADFLEEMPDRYVLSSSTAAIRDDARAFGGGRAGAASPQAATRLGLGLLLRPGPSPDVEELVITAPDRPGLLAGLTAVLAANRMAVQSAEIYTRDASDGRFAFDVFHLRTAGGGADASTGRRDRVARLEGDLDALLSQAASVETFLEKLPRTPTWARRHVPPVPTEVRVDNAASSRFTVVDVFSRDRLGLLHVVARTIHGEGLSIALSRVNTEGHRAADVFYVTEPGGGKVADPSRLSRLSVVLREAILGFHAFADGEPAGTA